MCGSGSMEVANPFNIEGEARRYQKYRPLYHHIPMNLIHRTVGRIFESSLDVACGTGHSTIALTKISKNTIGCDLSEEMLKEARRNYELQFVQADADNLPFADATFDFLNVSMGFHWLNHEKFLAEAKRVLTNDGYLALDNYGFSGQISPDPEKQKLHYDFFENNLPRASRRKGFPTEDLMKSLSLKLVKEFDYEDQLNLNANQFMNLIMTWSNFQILDEEQKAVTTEKMKSIYDVIFEGQSLNLKFGGKTLLYRFS